MKFKLFPTLAILLPTSAYAHESLIAHSHVLGREILNSSGPDYLLVALLIGGAVWLFRKKS